MYRIYIFRQIINTIGSCKRYDSPIQSIIKGLIKENSIIEKTAIIQKFINKRSSNTFLACFGFSEETIFPTLPVNASLTLSIIFLIIVTNKV